MKNKTAAGLFAILFGTFGGQYWYIEQKKKATKYLLISLFTFGIGAFVIWILGIIDGILFLTMKDKEFDEYVAKATENPELCKNHQSSNTTQPSMLDVFDAVKKYKGLLDAGALTQSEYDQIKAKLLRGWCNE